MLKACSHYGLNMTEYTKKKSHLMIARSVGDK